MRGDYVGFKPRRRWKTLMSLKTLAVSIVLFLIIALIITYFQ